MPYWQLLTITPGADTVELADNVILDLDKEGNIVCVEILDLRDASIMDGVSSLNKIKIKLTA